MKILRKLSTMAVALGAVAMLASCSGKSSYKSPDQMAEEAVANQKEREEKAAENAALVAKATAIITDVNKSSELPSDSTYAVTPTGLRYMILEEGTGAAPGAADQVTVNYMGQLLDGTVFDSSYDRGEPATFGLNQVIPGWTEGLQLMKEGGKAVFYIPSDLAYGDKDAGTIPPNSDLIFVVDLLKVN